MVDALKEKGKKNVLVCGPTVYKEAVTIHHEEYIWVLVSKSIKEKPEGCDILTDDYSLWQMMEILNQPEYKDIIGNIIVLGGVPVYNTVMDTTFKAR